MLGIETGPPVLDTSTTMATMNTEYNVLSCSSSLE